MLEFSIASACTTVSEGYLLKLLKRIMKVYPEEEGEG
jgi:hypothetical protein